jgi:hypothetical protein
MKMTRGKTSIEVSDSMVDYYENKGWVAEGKAEVKAKLKPVQKDTVETPAVESVEDSEEVVNDDNKGD